MSIGAKTRKMLWGRLASRCLFPDCRRPLVEDETETDDSSIVGDEAHIVAREPDGPRGQSDLTPEERDDFSNLILLCKVHHKLVDDQPGTYTVNVLHRMKEEHLDWVSSNLDMDVARQRDDEIYAGYVDRWLELAGANDWEVWSSWVLSGGQPAISVIRMRELDELDKYLFSRIWPHRYLALEGALLNFWRVLNDFRVVFMKHAMSRGDDNDYCRTQKFYQHAHHEDGSYYRQLDLYNFHVDLVEDLMLELTRAANDVCDEVRKSISPSFRLHEGTLLVTSGPDLDLRFKTCHPEYHNKNRYPGLREFMEVRAQRDVHFGRGVEESYFTSIHHAEYDR